MFYLSAIKTQSVTDLYMISHVLAHNLRAPLNFFLAYPAYELHQDVVIKHGNCTTDLFAFWLTKAIILSVHSIINS